tara:strand:+ start:118 stop:561 length:444 start_codon:yes stop_codon:yes gene_type:complete
MENKLKNFEKWKIGDKEILKRIIQKKDVDDFAKLTGDYNPLHMDDNFVSKTRFGKPVVHGMLSASFISTIIGTKIPGSGALWISQSLNFLEPVRIGDEITILASIIGKSESQKVLSLDIEIENQHKSKVITGNSKVKVVELFKRKND